MHTSITSPRYQFIISFTLISYSSQRDHEIIRIAIGFIFLDGTATMCVVVCLCSQVWKRGFQQTLFFIWISTFLFQIFVFVEIQAHVSFGKVDFSRMLIYVWTLQTNEMKALLFRRNLDFIIILYVGNIYIGSIE